DVEGLLCHVRIFSRRSTSGLPGSPDVASRRWRGAPRGTAPWCGRPRRPGSSAMPIRLTRLVSALPVAAALLGLLTATAPLLDRPATATDPGLAADLDKILDGPELDGAQAGLEVRDARSGEV